MLKLECVNYLGECSMKSGQEPIKGLIVASFELEGCLTVEEYTKFLLHLT